MNPAEIARRRRALHAGLRQVLPEAAARDAVEFWTREYATSPDLSLHRFVRALFERYPIRRTHHDVHALLWKTLIDTARSEGYDPAPAAPPPRLDPALAAAPVPPALAAMHRVALEVMTRFVEQIDQVPGQSRSFVGAAPRLMRTSPLPEPARRALAEALERMDAQAALPPACAAATLSQALTVLYEHACHAVGAVVADRVLSAAVAQAAALPEAREFPPTRLLRGRAAPRAQSTRQRGRLQS